MRKSLRHQLLTAAGIAALSAGIASNTLASPASEEPCNHCEDRFHECGGWHNDDCRQDDDHCLAINGCRMPAAAPGAGISRGRLEPGAIG